MIYMLVLNHEAVFDDIETLELFLDEIHSQSYNDITEETFDIFDKYLHECFSADLRLMEMTQEKLGDDVCPVVFIDVGECDDLNAFNFTLMAENEDRKVTFAEEKAFYNLCDICFGNIQGLFDRIFIHFKE